VSLKRRQDGKRRLSRPASRSNQVS
jgi:hypothetical protein